MGFLRWCIALCWLPLIVGLAHALLEGCASIFSSSVAPTTTTIIYFVSLGVMGLFYFCLRQRLLISYVFAHEMTHLLVGLCFFARPYSFRVTKSGGSVELSKTNIVITLAPYFIPFYVLVTMGVHALFASFWPSTQASVLWVILYGICTGHHIFFTLDTLLSVGQTDVRAYGRFFSYGLILLVNLVVASFAIAIIDNDTCTLKNQYRRTVMATNQAYAWTYATVYESLQRVIMR